MSKNKLSSLDRLRKLKSNYHKEWNNVLKEIHEIEKIRSEFSKELSKKIDTYRSTPDKYIWLFNYYYGDYTKCTAVNLYECRLIRSIVKTKLKCFETKSRMLKKLLRTIS